MVFKTTIPASTDFIAQSQIDMQNNTETTYKSYGDNIDKSIGDHVSLSEAEHGGAHRRATLVNQDSDPVTLANEAAIFGSVQSSAAELSIGPEGAGTTYQMTSRKNLSQNGLVLRAFVLFDFYGNIIENEYVDEDDEVKKDPVSFNVASVDTGPILGASYTITYTTAMPSADYFWSTQGFFDPESVVATNPVIQLKNNATYSSTVTANNIKVVGYDFLGSYPNGTVFNVKRILFKAYTVA